MPPSVAPTKEQIGAALQQAGQYVGGSIVWTPENAESLGLDPSRGYIAKGTPTDQPTQPIPVENRPQVAPGLGTVGGAPIAEPLPRSVPPPPPTSVPPPQPSPQPGPVPGPVPAPTPTSSPDAASSQLPKGFIPEQEEEQKKATPLPQGFVPENEKGQEAKPLPQGFVPEQEEQKEATPLPQSTDPDPDAPYLAETRQAQPDHPADTHPLRTKRQTEAAPSKDNPAQDYTPEGTTHKIVGVVGSEFGEIDNPARGGYTEPGWNQGAWGASLAGEQNEGVALPPSILSHVGYAGQHNYGQLFNSQYVVRIHNPRTGAVTEAPLKDLGPGSGTGALIDLLWGTRAKLGFGPNFKGGVNFEIINKKDGSVAYAPTGHEMEAGGGDPLAGQPWFSVPSFPSGGVSLPQPATPPRSGAGEVTPQAPTQETLQPSPSLGGALIGAAMGSGQPQPAPAPEPVEQDPMVMALMKRGFTLQEALNFAQGTQAIGPSKGLGPLQPPPAPTGLKPLPAPPSAPAAPALPAPGGTTAPGGGPGLTLLKAQPQIQARKVPPVVPVKEAKAPTAQAPPVLPAPPAPTPAAAPKPQAQPPAPAEGKITEMPGAAEKPVRQPSTATLLPRPGTEASRLTQPIKIPPQEQRAPSPQAPREAEASVVSTGEPTEFGAGTRGKANVPGFENLADLKLGDAGKAHKALLSPDDPRVSKQADGMVKGENFVEGDPYHERLLAGLPGGKEGDERRMLSEAEKAIEDNRAMHISYLSSPKEALKYPTRESRTVQYEEHSPEARRMGTTEGQLVGHSFMPVAVGIKLPKKKGDSHEGYIQGISTNVMANNFHHLAQKLESFGIKSPYQELGTKLYNDIRGYYSNLNAGHTGTGSGYITGTDVHPNEPDENHVPYKLTRKEADFINMLVKNTAAFSSHEDAQALRELARANGTLIDETGETNRLRHTVEQRDPGWWKRVLEPAIKTFNAGLIVAHHADERYMPETIRPGKEYQHLTRVIQDTRAQGRPDVAIGTSLHHTFSDNRAINDVERAFGEGKIDEAGARKQLETLGEDPDEYRFVGGSGGLITPYEDDPEAITPEEHEQMKSNLRQQWVNGKLDTEKYRQKAAEVPLPAKPSQRSKLEAPERINAAAIRGVFGDIYAGATHSKALREAREAGEKSQAMRTGFLTDRDRFIDEEEAYRLALASKQIHPSSSSRFPPGSKPYLTSEDLDLESEEPNWQPPQHFARGGLVEPSGKQREEYPEEAESDNMRPLGYRAAVLDPVTGEVSTARYHDEAYVEAGRPRTREDPSENPQFGFADKEGNFISMREADRILAESRRRMRAPLSPIPVRHFQKGGLVEPDDDDDDKDPLTGESIPDVPAQAPAAPQEAPEPSEKGEIAAPEPKAAKAPPAAPGEPPSSIHSYVSPNIKEGTKVAGALKQANTQIHQKARDFYQRVEDAGGGNGKTIPTIGNWEGTSEGSSMTHSSNDTMENARLKSAIRGLHSAQKGVAIFKHEEGGPDRMYDIDFPNAKHAQVDKLISEHKFPGSTIYQGPEGHLRAHLLDTGGNNYENAQQLAAKAGSQSPQYHHGHVAFDGGDTREGAASEYRRIARESGIQTREPDRGAQLRGYAAQGQHPLQSLYEEAEDNHQKLAREHGFAKPSAAAPETAAPPSKTEEKAAPSTGPPPAPGEPPPVRPEIQARIGPRPRNKTQGEIWDQIVGRLAKEIPGSIPMRPLKTKAGKFDADEKGNPKWEKEHYDIANAPLLEKLGKALGWMPSPGKESKGMRGLDRQQGISPATAPEGTEDTLDKGDLYYLKHNKDGTPSEDRLRVSYLNRISAVSSYADKLVEFFDSIKHDKEIMGAKGWYPEVEQMLKEHFGKHADMVANILAATSAGTGVRPNFTMAMNAVERYLHGDFEPLIKLYREGYDMLNAGTLRQHLFDAGITNELLKDNKEGNAKAFAHWIVHHGLVPTQLHGKISPKTGEWEGTKYGFNSHAVMKVLAHTWLEEAEGPKTVNYGGNLSGRTLQATIDMWAARTMRRLGYEGHTDKPWLYNPPSEGGVNNVDFGLSQLAFREAAKRVGMEPRELQAILWFAEQKLYQERGWEKWVDPNERDYRPMLKSLMEHGPLTTHLPGKEPKLPSGERRAPTHKLGQGMPVFT